MRPISRQRLHESRPFGIIRAMHRFGIALLVACAAAVSVSARGYDEMRADATARCETINPSDYQSGLAFNPDGYRSYYVRSECLQRTAVQFRDASLCRDVKQRRSLLWSSWGYSESRCRELVKEGIDGDRKALEEMKRRYREGAMMLRDFRVERNGNGRDFDVIPSVAGSYAHGYELRFEIIDTSSTGPVLVYATGSYLDATSNLRYFVRQSELRQRFPALTLNRAYAVRASVTLDVGNGDAAGYWSPQFIERVFPARDRTQSLTKPTLF